MSLNSPALSQLRAATNGIHQTLERDLIIARPDAGRADYISYLQALRGWMANFEDRLWSAPWPAEIDAQARRCKLSWIDEDLHAAGLDDVARAALPLSPFLPSLRSMPERIGLAYVTEGAQLGGQVLLKRLEPALKPWQPRWLRGYGPDTGTRWKSFVASAELLLKSEGERETAARAAHDAFRTLLEWCRLQHVA